MGADAALRPVVSLPRERGTFIGREDDVERLIALLQGPDCRLLTLLGPGGSGKTRLAVETARTSRSENQPASTSWLSSLLMPLTALHLQSVTH